MVLWAGCSAAPWTAGGSAGLPDLVTLQLTLLLACSSWAQIQAAASGGSSGPSAPEGERADAPPQHPTCKPQDGLALSPPYSRPTYLRGGLPLCSQFTCSCCNRTHTLLMQRALRPAFEDGSFSRACAAVTLEMACRVCDPEVGVGLKPAVCLGTCDRWYAACKDEYFGHDPRWDALMPCPEGMVHGAAGSGMLLCSKLHILAADGQQLCQVAGYPTSDSSPCYDGTAPDRPDLCIAPPPAPRRRATSGPREGDSGGAGWREWLPVVLTLLAVLLPLVARRFFGRGAVAPAGEPVQPAAASAAAAAALARQQQQQQQRGGPTAQSTRGR